MKQNLPDRTLSEQPDGGSAPLCEAGEKEVRFRYLEQLSSLYPTIAATCTEIINLQSILNLPKGTEHFITDIHGEYESFLHVLKNGSGSVKKKIDDVFGRTLSTAEKNSLATLIYYPREKMALICKTEPDMRDWYRITLYRLIEVCKHATSKYTRSKVRKQLPKDFAYVIEELITEKPEVLDKEAYYNSIIDTVIDIGAAEELITALCELIQKMVIDRLHILGDIFDRGPEPDRIMDVLMDYHSVDICWGNHDISWMGAAAGSKVLIANCVRICARYGNMELLENGYGINMVPLVSLCLKYYGNDPCEVFHIHGFSDYTQQETDLDMKIHKAITIIQFKLEGQLFRQYPDFHMEKRMMLHRIDYEKGTICLDGKTYQLLDSRFPTIDPADPYKLSADEEEVMDKLQASFLQCQKLQKHMNFLLTQGHLYQVFNGNLLYHGCMPLDEKGDFQKVSLLGRTYEGKALYDALEQYIRKAFNSKNLQEKEDARAVMYWLWCHPQSPEFGKDKMATFERYFLAEPETHVENKTPYYRFLENETVMNRVLKEFGLPETGHIVNGHVPVLQSSGENPVKCGGKVLIIDGGFAKAYQEVTGIAGYTLTFNSYGMQLVAHMPFTSTEEAIRQETDIHSERIVVMTAPHRLHVVDTDNGRQIQKRIEELKELLAAYREGVLPEHPKK